MAKDSPVVKSVKKEDLKNFPTLKLKSERDIALDFSTKVYQNFDKLIKAIILFGSQIKKTVSVGSDIDIIIIVDDASVKFDEELILWYREELGKIISKNPYKRDLHVNTVKLTTWWNDLINGDPTVINVIRYGEALIDIGGFFNPLRILLEQGKIKITPESIYNILNRIPSHLMRSRISKIGSIEGCYWTMVESAQALLMTIKIIPPSPEHISILLKKNFVDKGILKVKYVADLKNIYELHRKIIHGEVKDIDGKIIDEWQKKADDFFKTSVKLINEIISVERGE
ncbi:MAG: nucleotidyltransferase domain-containing protein [Candidatus Pacearchaeota archaeon]